MELLVSLVHKVSQVKLVQLELPELLEQLDLKVSLETGDLQVLTVSRATKVKWELRALSVPLVLLDNRVLLDLRVKLETVVRRVMWVLRDKQGHQDNQGKLVLLERLVQLDLWDR